MNTLKKAQNFKEISTLNLQVILQATHPSIHLFSSNSFIQQQICLGYVICVELF